MSLRTMSWGAPAAALSWLPVPLAEGQESVTLWVTSMKTDTVGVFRGRVADLELVQRIPVGREPHNLGGGGRDRGSGADGRRGTWR